MIDEFRTVPTIRAEDAFHEAAAYLLCLLATASEDDEKARSAGVIPSVASALLRFGRARGVRAATARGRRYAKAGSIVIIPQVKQFFQQLELGLSDEGLRLSGMFALLSREVASGPTFQAWGRGTLPITPLGIPISSVSRYSANYLRRVRALVAESKLSAEES